MTSKQKAWKWCSRYCRLRDALDYCRRMRIDTSQFARIEDLPVKCCTCNKVMSWIYADAGHFISRGSGGASGVYFDERNINAQSKDCNCFRQGAAQEYLDFMKEKYGQKVIDELRRKDKLVQRRRSDDYMGITLYYKEAYHELLMSL